MFNSCDNKWFKFTFQTILLACLLIQLTMSITFEIPKGLQELLQDFTVAVLKEKPSELIPFAAEYFNNLNGKESTLLPGMLHVLI